MIKESLNKDSEDLSNYVGQVARYTYSGFCTSFACAKYDIKGILKFPYDGPTNCPDCYSALVYRKKLRTHSPVSEI